MNSINASEKNVWVIKDSRGLFAHRGSVTPSDGQSEPYIVLYHSFSQECRGYLTEQQAEEALVHLNKKKIIAGLEMIFHLENNNLIEIIREHKVFQKTGEENMVIIRGKLQDGNNKNLLPLINKTAIALESALTVTKVLTTAI